MSAPHVSGVVAALLEKNRFNRTAALADLLRIARNGTLVGCPSATPNRLLQTPGARSAGRADSPSSGPSVATSTPAPSDAASWEPSAAPSETEAASAATASSFASVLLVLTTACMHHFALR
jgi:hypothetical protein